MLASDDDDAEDALKTPRTIAFTDASERRSFSIAASDRSNSLGVMIEWVSVVSFGLGEASAGELLFLSPLLDSHGGRLVVREFTVSAPAGLGVVTPPPPPLTMKAPRADEGKAVAAGVTVKRTLLLFVLAVI